MILTEEQFNVLAHVVIDPNAWYEHVCNRYDEVSARIMMEQKVSKHSAAYKEAASKPGYKTRSELEDN